MSKTPKSSFSLQNSYFRIKFFFDQNLDFVLGPHWCPGHFGWGSQGRAESVCFGLNGNQDGSNQAQGARTTVKAGQKINTPYTMVANHRGAFVWILAKAECGDRGDCFDVQNGVEEKFGKYFGYLARCEGSFRTTTLRIGNIGSKSDENAEFDPAKF